VICVHAQSWDEKARLHSCKLEWKKKMDCVVYPLKWWDAEIRASSKAQIVRGDKQFVTIRNKIDIPDFVDYKMI
jgi:hypothetical protein